MCLSDIARVISHDAVSTSAMVDIDGRASEISTITLGLDAPAIATDTWLVVHTGFAVAVLSNAEADAIRAARTDLARSTFAKETQ